MEVGKNRMTTGPKICGIKMLRHIHETQISEDRWPHSVLPRSASSFNPGSPSISRAVLSAVMLAPRNKFQPILGAARISSPNKFQPILGAKQLKEAQSLPRRRLQQVGSDILRLFRLKIGR